jgi:hypothetical protein
MVKRLAYSWPVQCLHWRVAIFWGRLDVWVEEGEGRGICRRYLILRHGVVLHQASVCPLIVWHVIEA